MTQFKYGMLPRGYCPHCGQRTVENNPVVPANSLPGVFPGSWVQVQRERTGLSLTLLEQEGSRTVFVPEATLRAVHDCDERAKIDYVVELRMHRGRFVLLYAGEVFARFGPLELATAASCGR